MNSSIFRFTLDLHRTQSQISIPVMLGDTGRTFRINLSDGGNPYIIEDGCLAKLSIKRPTGSRLEEFCAVEDNTTIVYSFEQNINTAISEGIHECDITLYGLDEKILGTAMFTMVVSERAVRSDDIVLTDEDFTAVDAMLTAEATRQATEKKRTEAEESRDNSEKERLAAELKRIEAEKLRDVAERERGKDLKNKVDKLTPHSTYTLLYGVKKNGEHKGSRLTPSALADSVMYRDANGHCNIITPTSDTHIANKGYVDGGDQVLQGQIDTLKALVDKLDKQLNPKMEVWRIRDDANIWETPMTVGFDFTANGVKFDGIQIGDNGGAYGDPHLVYLRNGEWVVYVEGMSGTHENKSDYLTIKIFPDQTLSEDFVTWLEANADYIGEEDKVEEDNEMITFSVNNYMYSCEHELTCPKGMTWGQYFSSVYWDSNKIELSGFDPDGMIVQISNDAFDIWYSYIFYGINSTTVIESGDYSGDEYFG